MRKVFVSIGSNIDRQQNIVNGLDALAASFGDMELSSIYESEAVGFDGENFYNLVASFYTSLSVGELSQVLKNIEADNGRMPSGKKFSARTLDIDILTYDTLVGLVDGVKLPRDEITENAFVLLPLREIDSEGIHPVLNKSYQQLWGEYSKEQSLWAIDFYWQDRQISKKAG